LKKNDPNHSKRLVIKIDSSNDWSCHDLNDGYILYKGNFSLWGEELVRFLSFLNSGVTDNHSIIEYISSVRGNFSLIVITDSLTIASVDHICSSQLYYLDYDESIVITDDVDYLKKQIDKQIRISSFSKLQILMSGYTLFDDTLYECVKSFIPGEVFLYNFDSVSVHNINNYQTWFDKNTIKHESLDSMQSKFNNILLEVMSETIGSLDGRQVVVPLSGGYDSRLIVSLLKYYNYENVICFTYGMKNNFEALAAESIANSLGYEWIFIDLNIKEQSAFYKSMDFISYLKYADVANSVPYYQGLYAVKYLKDNNKINEDAVFINGNSGDFITGGHMSKVYKFCNQNYLCNDVYKILIDKYYSLWGHVKNKDNVEKINKKVRCNYNNLKNIHAIDINACDFIYYYEFVNRQSKYVIQGQKTFEYYGYDWRLPLWDSKMIKFWVSIPNSYKNEQFLYKSTIEKYNYSNAWNKNDQINKYYISSYFARYTRRFFKFIVTILTVGNHKIWDRVDRTFFLYFYDITRMLCSVPYWKVVLALFKYPRHNVSFDAKKYLSDHEKSS
jgi:asparagine synthase (glutamine-hydrolysing)